jgi:hypothetical protein
VTSYVDAVLHVVMGPPCSGKTTYVRDHRSLRDVVVDMDALAEALGGSSTHTASGPHRAAALTCRSALVDRILGGRWETGADLWLIHHHPPAKALDRYRRARAELHLLDPGQAVCLARARIDKRPAWTATAIAEWYADPITVGEVTQGEVTPSRTW